VFENVLLFKKGNRVKLAAVPTCNILSSETCLTRVIDNDTVPLGCSKRGHDKVSGKGTKILAARKWKLGRRQKENLDLKESGGKLKTITQHLSCDAGESQNETKALAKEQLKRMCDGRSLKKTVSQNANGTIVWKHICRCTCCPLLILLRVRSMTATSASTGWAFDTSSKLARH
jgi:hypothetical protein